ncbi:MAG: hypothetical protein MRZ79_17605 [Bacteroidia bacterium]|nr:hypothetical protein [Bacteroidia bacterium]
MSRLLFTLVLILSFGLSYGQTCVTIKKTYRDVVSPVQPVKKCEPKKIEPIRTVEPVRTVIVERAPEVKKKRRKDRLHLQVGVAGNYLYDTNNETGFNPVEERTNYNAEALLGIRFDQGRKRANVLGVWGTAGFSSPQTVGLLLSEQGLAQNFEVDLGNPSYRFQEVEAGFLFKEWFRLSGGLGNQEFTTTSGENVNIEYMKFTTGLSLKITKSIKWNTNATFLMVDGSDKFSFRPSTGLSFRFNFLRI